MMLFLTLFALSSIFACSSAETFIVYGERSSISVLSSAGKEIKKFVISVSNSRVIKGIAIHYEEDLIFAVDSEKITKIHLLDDEGNPKQSGKGELFLDPKASHFESVLVVLSNEGIQPQTYSNEADEGESLTVDTNTHKLYIGGRTYVYEMNYNGTNVRKVIGTNFPSLSRFSAVFNNFLFHGNKAFVEVYSSHTKFNGIHETTINPTGMKNLTKESLIFKTKTDIYSMASDNTSKSIFFIEKNADYQIFAIEPKKREYLVPLKRRAVLSNYGVTLEPKALAVNGRTVAWCSRKYNRLFVGKMDKNKNFLPLKDIIAIPSNVTTYQMAIFETSSGQSFVVSSKYWLVIMLTFINAARNLI